MEDQDGKLGPSTAAALEQPGMLDAGATAS
jgi:hypothetical protein